MNTDSTAQLAACTSLISKLETTKNKANLKNSLALLQKNQELLAALRRLDDEEGSGRGSGSSSNGVGDGVKELKSDRVRLILELNANLSELNRIFQRLN